MVELHCAASTVHKLYYPYLGTNAATLLPFLINCTRTLLRMAELGCCWVMEYKKKLKFGCVSHGFICTPVPRRRHEHSQAQLLTLASIPIFSSTMPAAIQAPPSTLAFIASREWPVNHSGWLHVKRWERIHKATSGHSQNQVPNAQENIHTHS